MPAAAPSWWTAATSRCSSPLILGEYRRRELGFVFQFYNLVPDPHHQGETSRSRRTCPKTCSTSTICCVRWASTSTATNFRARSRAASSSAVPSAVRSSKTPGLLLRRAHGRARLQDIQGNLAAHGGRQPHLRLHHHHCHPQCRHRAHGQSRAAPARRAHRRG